ncbi:MAG: N-acetylmuramoyl-L-alanine amidase [Micavibrio aeruginosavorus]|uniref:N-acetylmuramoyl-L-alanine amidase n=1 Tax=Micavibrio aeruginosavorus TaxID=349221 RepID=A0A7T5R380_9BACT|nr:MAG: N-acetylmuramoyl-L-alanine amidase [Micavibrio aeruginosavorus]
MTTSLPAYAFSVNDIRFGSHPDKIRMVLELSDIQPFRVQTARNPWQMIIDMPDFEWHAANIGRPQGATITSIRQGALQAGISRIVIDFQHPVVIASAFILPRDAANNKPDRLVIDFKRSDEAVFNAQGGKTFGKLQVPPFENAAAVQQNSAHPTARPQMTATESNPSHTLPGPITIPARKPLPPVADNSSAIPLETTLETASATPQVVDVGTPVPQRKPEAYAPDKSLHKSGEKPVIVIDPGHGGVDPGALGANGVYEKQITLGMAKALKEELERTGRYKVVLTREKDTYLKLYKRVDFARQHNADLFISLHADSIGKANVQGASVYTLSEKASDEQTALLADRENRADLIAGLDLNTSDEQVATILVDLTMRDTMNQSKFFANKLVDHLDNNIKMLENPHRYAGFAVLKAPDIPSVLIEMGFMSNPREAEQLAKPEYRRTLARALVTGIDAYFNKLHQMQRS